MNVPICLLKKNSLKVLYLSPVSHTYTYDMYLCTFRPPRYTCTLLLTIPRIATKHMWNKIEGISYGLFFMHTRFLYIETQATASWCYLCRNLATISYMRWAYVHSPSLYERARIIVAFTAYGYTYFKMRKYIERDDDKKKKKHLKTVF